MTIRVKFTRESGGVIKCTDDGLRACANSVKSNGGPGMNARIDRELYEFAEDRLIAETNRIIASRPDMDYDKAAQLVHRMFPHLLTLHFCEPATSDLDVELDEGDGDDE